MLRKMVQYLMHNPDIVALVVNGQASLIGVSAIQQQAIIEVFATKEINEVEGLRLQPYSMVCQNPTA